MTNPKKSFSNFIHKPDVQPSELSSPDAQRPVPASRKVASQLKSGVLPMEKPAVSQAERVRTVTSTGRVRTYSAGRDLPGVTFRVTEERWERLKMMSIQERRPIQEILGDAVNRYMAERGLPW